MQHTRIVLAWPQYPGQRPLADRDELTRRPERVVHAKASGSLLCNVFNALWGAALDARDRGEVTHFAMCHSDVVPEVGGLDKLFDEYLRAGSPDVLSVVIPIKDGRGVTSTAIDDPDDPWTPLRRLTLKEVHQLPETFDAGDAGYPGYTLLVNTGFWLCDLRRDWCDEHHFEMRDGIRVVGGQRKPLTQPEDWLFSRFVQGRGGRVMATRKVSAVHHGAIGYSNEFPWGAWEKDEANAHKTNRAAMAPVPEGWKFPADVEGWLTETEGRGLASIAAGKDVLEIGSFCGRSTICIAQTARAVTCIDPFDGRATPRQKPTHTVFRENLARYDVGSRVAVCRGTTSEVAPRMGEHEYDLVFIDGAHDVENVRNDITHALRLLRPGGTLAFHDYRKFPGEHDGGWDPGVTQAVDELIARGGTLEARHGSVAVIGTENVQRNEIEDLTNEDVAV